MGDALNQLQAFAWPLSRLSEAFAALALPRPAQERAAPLPDAADPAALDAWLSATAAAFELETEPATRPYSGLADYLQVACPALLRLREGFILLLPKSRLLAPDRSVHRVSLDALASALSEEIEAPVAAQVDDLVKAVDVPERRRARVRQAIIRERLASRQIGGCWLLRLPPGSDFRRQLRENGVQKRLIILASAHFIQYALFIASWWVVGVAALHGRLDRAWLFAWALL